MLGNVFKGFTSKKINLQNWMVDKEVLLHSLQANSGRKVLLLTDLRVVFLSHREKVTTDEGQVLWKQFVGVRQHRGGKTTQLDVSIKTENNEIDVWQFDHVANESAVMAYAIMKKRELEQKSRPPPKKDQAEFQLSMACNGPSKEKIEKSEKK